MNKTLLTEEQAIAAVRVFLGTYFRDLHQKNAILHIVESTSPDVQTKVATETIKMCLGSFIVKRTGVFDTELLSVALSIAQKVQAERDALELLVHTAASAGFHGRFPELPKDLLGREMSGDEVILLISSYVNDRGARCEGDEVKFARWAHRYLPPLAAREQTERIRLFVRDWENTID